MMTRNQARGALALIGVTSILIAAFIGTEIEETETHRELTLTATSTQLYEKTNTTSKGYAVTHVVDGDTVDVEISGKKERVRLIGINTPETVDPRRSVQCFGAEASAHLHDLLDGEKVFLVIDPAVGDVDKYGRLLRYVHRVRDDEDVNASQIANGFAYEYTYHGQYYENQAEYKKLQENARSSQLGLWSLRTCNGKL